MRRESVINLAHRYRTDDEHVDHVARLSLQMFDALAEAGLHELATGSASCSGPPACSTTSA